MRVAWLVRCVECGDVLCPLTLLLVFVLIACCGRWAWADDVSTPTGSLATAGGAFVVITGRNLGMAAAAVSLSYSGGSTGLAHRAYAPTDACEVVSAGTHIRCPSAPGVGANYSFVVTVDGGASDGSSRLLSYTQPAISSVDGPGANLAPAAGGVPIFLHGSNFGPVNSSTTLLVWAVPAANDSLSFPGVGCVVMEADTTIACTTGSVRGATLSWRVQVEGLVNTMPQSTVAAPRVTAVSFADEGVSVASTLGGTALVLSGVNFGNSVSDTVVTVTVPGRVLDAEECVMTEVDTQLRCVLPPGTGSINRVSVTVLGQTALLEVTGLAYAAPSLSAVTPSTWASDLTTMTVVLRGTGFGGPAQSGQVVVSATGDTGCPGVGVLTVAASAITVLNDTELSFVIRDATPRLVRQWTLAVSVAGQSLAGDATSRAAAILRTRAPGAPTLTFAAPSNGTHRFLLLTGSDFGPGVFGCRDDVAVTVEGRPCAALSMTQVCTRGCRALVTLQAPLLFALTPLFPVCCCCLACATSPQAHQQLLCVTTQSRGAVVLSTGAGVTFADFDASVLQQPPVVTSVAPSSWSTTTNTSIVIAGERCVLCGEARTALSAALGLGQRDGGPACP
jgi:hypothetical protein